VALQFRRGTAANRTANNFTPVVGEPIYETDTGKLFIGDGLTVGGVNVNSGFELADLSDVTLTSETINNPDTYSVTSNVLTLVFDAGHPFAASQSISIANSSITALNGSYTVTSVTTTNVVLPITGVADTTSTALTANVFPNVIDGDVIYWDNATGSWKNRILALNDLSDVNLTVAPTNSNVLKYDGTEFIAGSADLVEDTTPQLGGDLDVNGNDIVSTSNGNISVAPDGTGELTIKGNATGGSGKITLNCEVNTHGVTIQGPPHSAAATYDLVLPDDMGTSGYVLSTDGTSATSWIAPPATTLDGLTDVNVPTPSDGEVLIYNTTSSQWEAGQAASPVLHTTFDFAYSGTTPTGTVANSTRLGRNYGTWTEVTSALIYGPSSSTYDPTLQGVTFSSSTGKFTGFPAGRYQMTCSFSVVIDNVTPSFGSTLAHFLNADNVAATFSYASQLSTLTPLPYASYGSAAHEFPVNLNLFVVFEETTGSNNQFEIFGDQDMSPSYYITYGSLNILKVADL
jgi:hypothetical protein